MKAKLIEAVRSLWRKKTTVTLELDGLIDLEKYKDTYLKVDIDIYRKKRSLSANAYFHVLSDKLADKNSVSKTCQKNELITKYGQKLFIDNKPAVIKQESNEERKKAADRYAAASKEKISKSQLMDLANKIAEFKLNGEYIKKSFEVKDLADISEKDYYTVINNIELVKEKGDKYKESENG